MTRPAQLSVETMGNAIVLVREHDTPLLVTDPWLVGTAYYGSWALDHPLSEAQKSAALQARYLWISHGHPDHLHPESIAMFPRDVTIVLGRHYRADIENFFRSEGFSKIVICENKQWMRLSQNVRILCVSNINQDTILAIEVGDTILLNMNDSGLFGEGPFFRTLIRRYTKSYLSALCAIDADMMNYVDEDGRSVAGDPEQRKSRTIVELARRAEYLGVENYCCSSSQHLYVRADSVWANPYRISWSDMQRHWDSKRVRLIEAFVTIDLDGGELIRNHPSQESDTSQITGGTGSDAWDEPMSADDWTALETFIRRFETLQPKVDFVEFTVGGATRRFFMTERSRAERSSQSRGVVFHVPRRSLMDTVQYGYFDDLLIGNFMKTHLVNMALYPHFTPRIAKYGGNAKVFRLAELRDFRWHYFKESPVAFVRSHLRIRWDYCAVPWLTSVLRRLGVFESAKIAYLKIFRRA